MTRLLAPSLSVFAVGEWRNQCDSCRSTRCKSKAEYRSLMVSWQVVEGHSLLLLLGGASDRRPCCLWLKLGLATSPIRLSGLKSSSIRVIKASTRLSAFSTCFKQEHEERQMSSQASVAELQQAIIRSVEHGAYPESEDISSAELTPNILPAVLTELQKARDEVKVWVGLHLSYLSNSNAFLIGRHSSIE